MSTIVMDFTVSFSHILTLVAFGLALIGQWYSLKNKSEKNFDVASSALQIAAEVKKEVSDLRVEILKEYASTRSLQAVEDRLSHGISDLTSEIRQLREFLMERKN